jgi:eukaryotic-like serine/threonine-protein kinase
MIGQLVGHYRVLEKIGAGAMGEVFRARDERLGRDVALKLIRPAYSDNPDHLRRFEQEARAAAALNHPNILAIYDVGLEGETPYIVSELLQGKTLRHRLMEGTLPVRETSDYALQIAHGLTAAHERHIVHRDLKPENLFLTHDGRVKILDFGVAKLQAPPEDGDRSVESMTTVTKHGTVIGTVAYMSPEQLRGKMVDHRSDIFSFGAILYEMLAGCRAFRGETEVDTITAVLREEPPAANLQNAAIPDSYQEIVRHCVEKEPENRFQSAKDLAFAIQTLSGSGKTIAFGNKKGSRSSLLPWAMVAVLGLALAVLALAKVFHAPPASPIYRRLTFEAGTVFAARFAPDGRSIIYAAAWGGKPVQLFSTVGNSLLAQPLNFDHANLLAISSANELAVVLNGTHDGQLETVDGVLARAPMAGGSPREVLPDVRWADWSPKDQLAVVHAVGGHSRLEFPIGNVLYQSSGWISNIRFSPGGDHIAFMDHPALWDNRGVVAVADLAGHVRRLSQEWESEGGLAWRPDGKEIWFTAIEKGHTLNLMAVGLYGGLRMLLDLPVGITLEDVAPDGRVLAALNSSRLAIGFTRLGSQEEVDLSWHDWENARDISGDGEYVLFEDASEADGAGYSVVLRKVDGTLPVRLGEGSSGGLSPDGKWAVALQTNQPTQLTLLPIGAGQPRTLNVSGLQHIHNGWARFLPDGHMISIIGDETGHAPRCYLVDVATGHAKPVTPESVLCGPSAPDGRQIIGKSTSNVISVYPVDGGAPKLIPNLAPNFVPVQWSEDGSSLYGYHAGEIPSRVYRVAFASGKETPVQEFRPGVPAGVVTVAPVVASRDGKKFAYSYNQTLSVLYLISGLR